MSLAGSPEPLRIEIDLREPRAASERLDQLTNHAKGASAISKRIRALVDGDDGARGSEVTVIPMLMNKPPTKMAPQIIDAISIGLAPMGVAGIVKFVVQIVEACHTHIPTKYEIDLAGIGKLILSGPHVAPQQVRELLQLMAEACKLHPSGGRRLSIKAQHTDHLQ